MTLQHVLFVGGGSCAGKSTLVDRLVERHGFEIYDCDVAWKRHSRLVTSAMQPVFSRVRSMTNDERWTRSVEHAVRDELAMALEQAPLIVDDLESMPRQRPVIAVGNALLPEVLAAHDVGADRAVWLIPAEEFQREIYGQREWVQHVLAECQLPSAAWETWMGRDVAYARAIAERVDAHAYRRITVDRTTPIELVDELVSAHFGLGGAGIDGS